MIEENYFLHFVAQNINLPHDHMVMVMVMVTVRVMVMAMAMVMVMVMGNLLPRKVPWLKIPMTPTKKVPSDAKQQPSD